MLAGAGVSTINEVASFDKIGVGTDNDDEIEIGTVASEAGVSSLSGSANTAVSVEAGGKGWDSTNGGVSSCGNVWGGTSFVAACSKVLANLRTLGKRCLGSLDKALLIIA